MSDLNLPKPRAWTYSREEWSPWRARWVPYFGGDEWGRRTVVLPIPFGGYLVIALGRGEGAEE